MLPSNCHLPEKEGREAPKGSEWALSPLFLLTLPGTSLRARGWDSALAWKAWGKVSEMGTGQFDPKAEFS